MLHKKCQVVMHKKLHSYKFLCRCDIHVCFLLSPKCPMTFYLLIFFFIWYAAEIIVCSVENYKFWFFCLIEEKFFSMKLTYGNDIWLCQPVFKRSLI